MKKNLKDFLKKATSVVLSAAMVLGGINLPSNTYRAEAATANLSGLNNAIIKDASKYLGYGYISGSSSVSNGGFDCSGLVYRVLRDLNISGIPSATGAANDGNKSSWDPNGWLYKVEKETLSLTYSGVSYSKANGNMVCVS